MWTILQTAELHVVVILDNPLIETINLTRQLRSFASNLHVFSPYINLLKTNYEKKNQHTFLI